MKNAIAILFLSAFSVFGAAFVEINPTTSVITYPTNFATANGLGGGSGSGESNTVSSLGTGWRMFANKNGVDLRFNTLSNAFEFLSTSNNNVITLGLSAAAISGFSGTSNQVNTVQAGLVTTSNRVETVNTAKQDHTANLDSWSALATSAKQDALGFTPARGTMLISTTAPLAGGGDLSADRTLTMAASSDSVDGYLTSGDHTSFNAKVAATRSISTTAPLAGGGDLSANRTLSMAASSDEADGYLTSSDHASFAAKQAAFTTGLGITNRSGVLSNNITAGTHIDISAGANGQETIATTGLVVGVDIEAFSTNLDSWSLLATSAKQDALGFTATPNTRTISTTAPITGGGDLSANRTFVIPAASDSTDGYLSGADHTIFNAKVSTARSISSTAPITGGGDLSANRTFAIAASSDSVDGYLTAGDHTTFNAKVGTSRSISTTAPITGGGDLSANRTLAMAASSDSVDGYLSAADHTTFNAKVGTSRTITAGAGLSGGGDLSANRTLTVDLSTFVGNITVWDASQASRTWTANLSGATDPVWTYGNNSADLTTGVLKYGGNTVATTSIIGSTIQGWDTDLDGIAAVSTTGYVKRTGSGTFTAGTAISLTADVTGVLPVANFATGTPTGSKFVRDDGALAVPGGTTYTGTANQVIVTGTVLSTPQDIGTASTPTFGGETIVVTALGATPSGGLLSQNTTAAGAGAQQVSPPTIQEGQGWKTTATAASQSVKYRNYVTPVQGAANPSGTWNLESSINAGAYANGLTYDTAGSLVIGLSLTVGNTGALQYGTRSGLKCSADGLIELFNAARTGFTALNFGGTSASFPQLRVSGTTLQHRLADNSADGPMSAGAATFSGDIAVSKTITAPGTTGNQTINKTAGRVNIAAAGNSITVTDSLVTANSIVVALAASNDTTALVKNVVASSGSFVITMNANVTSETAINFMVIN